MFSQPPSQANLNTSIVLKSVPNFLHLQAPPEMAFETISPLQTGPRLNNHTIGDIPIQKIQTYQVISIASHDYRDRINLFSLTNIQILIHVYLLGVSTSDFIPLSLFICCYPLTLPLAFKPRLFWESFLGLIQTLLSASVYITTDTALNTDKESKSFRQ